MNWPINFLLIVVIYAVVAIIIPWMMPRAWCKRIVAPTAVPCASTILWLLYEQQLTSAASSHDPLIRIDLFLIIPLMAIDWISAVTAVVFAQLAITEVRQQYTEHTTEKGASL